MKTTLSMVTLAVLALGMAGCESGRQQEPPNTLVAVMASGAPDMLAGANDPVWAKARPLNVALTSGANFGAPPGDKGDSKVMLKAV